MKMLVFLDGSKFAEYILEPVRKLVARSDGTMKVHLIRVIDAAEAHNTWIMPPATGPEAGGAWLIGPPAAMAYRYRVGAPAETRAQGQDSLHTESKDYLSEVAGRVFPGGTVHQTVTFGGAVADEILAYARREDVGLIGIATHKRTGLARTLRGSVAGKLLRVHVASLFMVRPDHLDEGGSPMESWDEPGTSSSTDMRWRAA